MSQSTKSFLDSISNGTQLFSKMKHKDRIAELLRYFSSIGLSLEVASDKSHLNRSVETLKRYCCRYSIEFPDYIPRHLRPRNDKKG